MVSDINESLAKRIAYLQSRTNLTKAEIAKRMGIDRTAFSRIVNGGRKISADELSKLADIFDVTTDYLLGRPEPHDDLRVAAHRTEGVELTESQKQDIEDYIEFQKAKYRKEHENKD